MQLFEQSGLKMVLFSYCSRLAISKSSSSAGKNREARLIQFAGNIKYACLIRDYALTVLLFPPASLSLPHFAENVRRFRAGAGDDAYMSRIESNEDLCYTSTIVIPYNKA